MTDRIAITARDRINDSSALPVTAKFYTAGALAAPTNAYYRVDTPDGCQVLGWTSLSPASSISFTVSPEANEASGSRQVESRILTIAADKELAGQYVEKAYYEITCLGLAHAG